MSANKKNMAGLVSAAVAAVIAIVAFILYIININSKGYFEARSVSNMELCSIGAIAAIVLAWAIGAATKNIGGIAGKCISIVCGLLQIAAPVLLALCLINLGAARADGLGYIYFSNADVAKEVQTAENMSSASMAIASMVAYGAAMLAAMVNGFFTMKKN